MWEILPEIILRTFEHLLLVIIAMSGAIALGIPLGILLTRQPQYAQLILTVANSLQTIPSLAIFGFLLSLPLIGGIGKTPAIIALTLYALLPLIRNTYIGINQVDANIKEAAKAMGMTDWQLLTRVEIPLALGVIFAGIRVATVISVGIATIAAAIGGGGLGVFIFRGISTVNNQLILAGAVPAAILALLLDGLIGWFESQFNQVENLKVLLKKPLSLFLITAFFLVIIIAIFASFFNSNQKIIIGSKDFTEQVILSEIIAQQIENKTNLTVQRQLNLGGTFICHEALKKGQIDGYVEYTGTAFTAILKQKPINNPQLVYNQIKEIYQKEFNLKVLPDLGFENTFAILIRQEDAQKWQLKTITDAAPYTNKWQAGFGPEFLQRADGYLGLSKTYNLKFTKPPIEMNLGLMYQALATKKVDLVAGNSTDGLISKLNLFMLEDNLHYFPPYQAVPIFSNNILTKYPEIEKAIAPLFGKISAEEMRQLNYQVDQEQIAVTTVVRQFLKTHQF
ncbi:MAG TPA: glycine betaine ABC transporter substrate-binding protein [Allocoleopsis sp.]